MNEMMRNGLVYDNYNKNFARRNPNMYNKIISVSHIRM